LKADPRRNSMMSMPSQQMIEEQWSLGWCRKHGLEPAFVRANMDVYSLFLNVPPALHPVTL
jgi:hypothetical protein